MYPAKLHRKVKRQRGYIMLVAMVLLALLAVLGTSTLNIAGIDQRIANRNRQHVLVVNTASAGNEDGRDNIRYALPTSEGYNMYGVRDTAVFIDRTAADASFGGSLSSYAHNLGVYRVDAMYHRCGNPPPGYSTEQGNNGFRSDYWELESIGTMTEQASLNVSNESMATTSTMIQIVRRGSCKVR